MIIKAKQVQAFPEIGTAQPQLFRIMIKIKVVTDGTLNCQGGVGWVDRGIAELKLRLG